MDMDEQRIASYLMGDLPEADQAELERQYFADQALVDRVFEVETRLLDDYARGLLPDAVRQRVARQYLAHPTRRERLKFAEAFAARVDDAAATTEQAVEAAPSVWQALLASWPGGRRTVQLTMAIATLLLVVAFGWLSVEQVRLREDSSRVQAAREQRERERQPQLEAGRPKGDAAIADRRPPAQPTPPVVVSLVFTVGGVRGPTDPPRTLKIPAGTEQVRLQLNLKDNDYVRYGIAVRVVGGAEILGRQDLRPDKTDSGWRLVLDVPANRLRAGDYVVALTGVTRAGDRDDVSVSIVRVEP